MNIKFVLIEKVLETDALRSENIAVNCYVKSIWHPRFGVGCEARKCLSNIPESPLSFSFLWLVIEVCVDRYGVGLKTSYNCAVIKTLHRR